MRKIIYSSFLVLSIALLSCDGNKSVETQKKGDSLETDKTGTAKPDSGAGNMNTTMEKGGIKLTIQNNSPEFPDAIMQLNAPAENAKVKAGDVEFKYEVKNYKLKDQTSEKGMCGHCANSDKGQHIHLILNNEPYIALYEPASTQKLKDGHYVALSFLSRSYHESIKTRSAYDIRQFTVGKGEAKKVDLSKPMLFYSRPKGEYYGEETKQVLLDFYLVNTDLSENGNKVRATINGNEFVLNKWQPYIIEGLPMQGEATIKLELIDKDGKLVESPYNSIERKIKLLEKKPS